MKSALPVLALLLALVLGGCNTVRGFGEDMRAAGTALTNSVSNIAGTDSRTVSGSSTER